MYPFDSLNVKMDIDFFPVKRQFIYENDKFIYYDKEIHKDKKPIWVKFQYHLLYCLDFTEMIKFKHKTLDNLATHNIFHNYKGFKYDIYEKNKCIYTIKLVRSPYSTIKVAIIPIIVLMLFSLTTAVYGDYDDQLGNLLAVYLA